MTRRQAKRDACAFAAIQLEGLIDLGCHDTDGLTENMHSIEDPRDFERYESALRELIAEMVRRSPSGDEVTREV